ncbi:MAG: ABC transporter substrate-binding protein, partial [Terriglobia bacterium]
LRPNVVQRWLRWIGGLAWILIQLTCIAAADPLPQRIVSTAPAITEILFALSLGERIVGVTTFCQFPEAARRIPKVGGFLSPNVEVLLSLRPDLVIFLSEKTQLQDRLRQLGLAHLPLNLKTTAGLLQAIQQIGETTGKQTSARQLTASIREQLDAIRTRIEHGRRKRVLFVVGRTPGTLSDLRVAGAATYLDEIISVAGGENVFQNSQTSYPPASKEELLRLDPEVVFDFTHGAQATAQKIAEVKGLWAKLPALTAVRKGQIYILHEDYFLVPGPRVVQAAERLSEILQAAE